MNLKRPKYEIADVLKRYILGYLVLHKITIQQNKVISALIKCRTKALGGHIEKCSNPDCDYETNAYNSCRDRHCPKCNGSKNIKWVSDRLKEVLPTPYFHVVFTMPHILRNLALFNQAVIYDLFFKATSYTLHKFSKDKRYLGARMGFLGLLHTWGQTLSYHAHIHYIITGGGLLPDKSKWIRLPYKKKFLFPVKAMSKVVRGRFLKLLKEAYREGKLEFPGELEKIKCSYDFNIFCSRLYDQNWYIYSKRPFCGPSAVLRYFSRYTHRIAISNDRLVDIEGGKITFRYRDYKDDGKIKLMTLSADEFLSRYTKHILPFRFNKVRYYGILNPRLRVELLPLVRELLKKAGDLIDHKVYDYIEKFSHILDHLCPVCKTGKLIFCFDTF